MMVIAAAKMSKKVAAVWKRGATLGEALSVSLRRLRGLFHRSAPRLWRRL